MIEVKNINKTFADKQVLKGITATFHEGQTNLIIGRSGSGKTVLLKTIAGLVSPDPEAQILYDNRNFLEMEFVEKKQLRSEIGMVFQFGALFDSMTVEQNVRFPLDMFSKMSSKEKTKQVNFCLERVDIKDSNKKFPSELSGGMKKRVAIARAIALNPHYLFCDEPNSGLDPMTSILIDKLIHEITVEYGITTIVNTHDMNSVMEIGDKIIFIHEGNKCWEGSNKEVMTSDNELLNEFIFSSNIMKELKSRNDLL